MGLFKKSSDDTIDGYGSIADEEQQENNGYLSRVKQYVVPGRLNTTRIAFSSFLTIGFMLALLLRDGIFGLTSVPGFQYACDRYSAKLKVSCSPKYAVYRVSFSLVCFYGFFALLASRIFCVGDKTRLFIQYKWFLLKIPVFLGFLGLPWIIPDAFFYYFAWVALFASGLFLVIQIVLLIDFAYAWSSSWRSSDNEGTNIWDILQLVSAIVLLLVAVALIVLSIVFFGAGRTCHLNRFFALFTVAVSIVLVVLSMARHKGLLPAAVVVGYGAFCVWSAMLSDPSSTCNRLKHITSGGKLQNSKASEITTAVFGVVIAVFSLVRCTVSTGLSFSSFFKLSRDPSDESSENSEKLDREECSELFFSHLVFLLGSFYMAMVLVSWDVLYYKENNQTKYQTEVSKAAMWVKIASQWLMFALFSWTLIAPKILGKYRDFDGEE